MSQQNREEEAAILREFCQVLKAFAIAVASLAVIALAWKLARWLWP